MPVVKPFKGFRPCNEEFAKKIASRPYDVLNSEEAKAEAAEMYDVGDPTNELGFWDYYEIIEV